MSTIEAFPVASTEPFRFPDHLLHQHDGQLKTQTICAMLHRIATSVNPAPCLRWGVNMPENKWRLRFLLLLILLLSACSAPGKSPSRETPTAIVPTRSSVDEDLDDGAAMTPALPETLYSGTPLAPMNSLPGSSQNPYLAGYDYRNAEVVLIAADPHQPIHIPAPRPYEAHILPAPSGSYIAYIGGDLTSEDGLLLILLDTASREMVARLPVLAPGWEASQRSGVEPSMDPVPAIVDAGGMAWSGDGRYLAFTAAIDRFHPDIYILDTRTFESWRAAAAEHAPNSILWSPNAERIAYLDILSFGTGAGRTYGGMVMVEIASGTITEMPATPDGAARLERWLEDDRILLSDWDMAVGPRDLTVVEPGTGRTSLLLEGPLYALLPLPEDHQVAVLSVLEDAEGYPESLGLFFVPLDGTASCHIALPDSVAYSLDWSSTLQAASVGMEESTAFYTKTCDLLGHLSMPGESSFSPDGNWVATLSREDGQVLLFSLIDQESVMPDITGIQRIFWSPDSAWLLMTNEDNDLYALSVGNEEEERLNTTPQLVISDIHILWP